VNLLFLDSVDRKTFGGYQNWINLMSRALTRRGHKIFVAGRPASEYLRRVGADNPGVELIPLKISGDFNPWTIGSIRNIMARHGIDVIICDFNKDLRLGGLASKLHGRVKVIWRLGLDITKDNWVHRFLTPRLADAVVVPSEGLKKQIIRFGYLAPEDVTVIYHGIPARDFPRPNPTAAAELRRKYNIDSDKIVAVTSGRFVNQKGHTYLIEAAAKITARFPGIIFLWLGDGPLEESLRIKIHELGLDKYFVFAGMLDNLDPELAGSDLMLHPSLDEPFGFSVLEGMRAGLPVVASRVGGIPEVVEENVTAILVKAGSPEELAEAVLKILENPTRMSQFGIAGQKRWREYFREEIMLDKWEVFLEKLMGPQKNK